jgi:hypothetical protein
MNAIGNNKAVGSNGSMPPPQKASPAPDLREILKVLIKAKMQQEGVNPDIIDRDPSALIPLKETKVCIHIYICI